MYGHKKLSKGALNFQFMGIPNIVKLPADAPLNNRQSRNDHPNNLKYPGGGVLTY